MVDEHGEEAAKGGLRWLEPVVSVVYIALVVYGASLSFELPTPKPEDAPQEEFSEARARSILLDGLSSPRTAGSPGWLHARDRVLAHARSIQHTNEKLRNPLRVSVALSDSGSNAFTVKGLGDYTNAAVGATNIELHISPWSANASSKPALLWNAHFDAYAHSPGASVRSTILYRSDFEPWCTV
jgi:hypothetical protein